MQPTPTIPLADRLRANLRAAEIPAPEVDVERLIEEGVLERMEPHLRALRAVQEAAEPDYVASRRDGDGGARPVPLPARPRAEPHAGLPGTISEVSGLLRDSLLSPVELVDRALLRIEERDGELNAFQLVLDARARTAAREAEAEIARGGWRGPLHGVPVAVKDLFDVAGCATTAGSRRVSWPPSAVDAAAVALLERSGGIVVGKTRLPEYAFWPGSRNPHYGPTANPHDASRDAGGSSSGSAAAVADGMAYAALGSDTGGSIRIPAAFCGVVGLKPTYARVSLEGCVPLAWSLDHGGPLARSVEDAAVLLDVLSDTGGSGTRAAGPGRVARSEDVAPPGDLSGLRVAALGDDGSSQPLGSDEALAQWRRSLGALEAAGATLVDLDLPDMTTLRAVSFLILSVEAASYHAAGLRARYDEYGEPARSRLLAGFAYGADDFVQAQRKRRLIRQRWTSLFERIDVLSTPSQPTVAPALGEIGSVRFTSPFNALGWPALSVPFGTGERGLPLATQLVALPWREDLVLRAGRALEETR